MGDLTQLERDLLDFEAAWWWRAPGGREAAIRELFGHSAARHAQLLLGLLERPEAWAYAPTTVKRLRAQRAQRRAARTLRPTTSA